ncbi:response regulator transcription factor [Clostridium sp. PL3]|uniref:Response regulator transcription factor n=1 Tax=Clostridium thailandense TaxID=2794346 RepID=A0A949TXU2_9CLOT|nr:response regulator transcription factor [Clostridium thailandense]MBV7272474.1 response regulator transcription factor [Clostridium thailandense]
MKKVLIADDEKELVELLSLYLEKEYELFKAYDGSMALDILQSNNIDIAVIDIMMPNIDGYQLIKRIREKFNIPVIMLSAKGEYSDRILGLELGADDYVTKPFNPLEIAARIKAQLRRYYKFNENTKEKVEIIEFGTLRLDKATYVLYKNNEEVALTSTEYKILLLLMSSPGRVFTKKQIFEQVWEETFYGDDNSIMVHMSKLREKIEEDSKKPIYIKTIRGLGYKFMENLNNV